MDNSQLLDLAIRAMESVYAPYSHFHVGAALLTESGEVYTGCNIENAAFTPTVCAERVAIFKAVSEGNTDFVEIAVAGGSDEVADGVFPCGVCRQVMVEFCDSDFKVTVKVGGLIATYRLDEIIPYSFSGDDLKGENA